MNMKETQTIIKDLILFDSVWNKRNKTKQAKKLPTKALERLKIYRELVRNSLFSLISNFYPCTHKILNKHWKVLLSKYIEQYPPNSPILSKVGEHFPEFLKKEKSIIKKYPFISELALYEWLEVETYEQEDNEVKNKQLVLNPIHTICRFEYQIPEIAEKIKDKKPLGKIKKEQTNVLIYRDPKDFSVRFIELSNGTVAYLELSKSGFPHEMIPMLLASHYNIQESDLGNFNVEIKKLVETLKKSRILIQQTT